MLPCDWAGAGTCSPSSKQRQRRPILGQGKLGDNKVERVSLKKKRGARPGKRNADVDVVVLPNAVLPSTATRPPIWSIRRDRVRVLPGSVPNIVGFAASVRGVVSL